MSHAHTFYVVLQGEFVLFRQKSNDPQVDDTMRILAPLLDNHDYKAGPWRSNWYTVAPLPGPNSPLQFVNVHGDRKQGTGGHCQRAIPENNTDIFLHIGPEAPGANNARVDITAPLPLAILPGLRQTTETVKITVNTSDGTIYPDVPPTQTVIPILVYKWFGDAKPFLADQNGKPVAFTGGPSRDFQSMQIYASSPNDDEDAGHAQDAFHKAAWLLGEDADITWTYPTFSQIFATPPAGLTSAQINLFFSDVLSFDPHDPALLAEDLLHPSTELPFKLPFDKSTLESSKTNNCGTIVGQES